MTDEVQRPAYQTVLTSDGARLNVGVLEPTGATRATPTAVLAHGWCLSHETWAPVARRLLTHGIRSVMWDQRGHGSSSFAHGSIRSHDESIRRLGQDAARVIEAVVPGDAPLLLGGHSMGGMTMLAFAGQFPDIIRYRTTAVALCGTASHDLRTPTARGVRTAMRLLAAGPALATGPFAPEARQAKLLFGKDPRPADVSAATAVIKRNRITTTGAFFPALGALDEERSLAVLDRESTTIISGTRDKLTPVRYAKEMARLMPHARLELVESAGHMVTYEAADLVTQALLRGV